MNVGVFLPNWIGDAVMATPTLRALRRHCGEDAGFVGIMKPHIAEVLEGTTWLDEMWLYDRDAADPSMRSWAVTRRIHALRFDLIVLLPNTFHQALMAWLGRARERAGYARYKRGPLLTLTLHPPGSDGRLIPYPTLDYYLQIAYALGCPEESPKMELATTIRDEMAADRTWHDLGLPDNGRIVAFNSSGAFGGAKLWPDAYFSELARRVVSELGYHVVILCGPGERERVARIAGMAGCSEVVSLADQHLSIGLSKACVRRSRLLVTTDSGPRHFAAAFNVPVISLFGPTHIAWSDTHYSKEVHLQIPVECGPCQQRICPLGHHKCMTDLGVDQVYKAVCATLDRTS